MKLSERTRRVLINAAQFSPGIIIDPGKTIRACSLSMTTLLKAEIEEEFPCQIAIADTKGFLAAISALKDPDLDIQANKIMIRGEGRRLSYNMDNPKVVQWLDKKVVLPDPFATVVITSDQINEALKMARILSLPEIYISENNGVLRMGVYDSTNPTTHDFSIDLGSPTNETFKCVIKTENLLLLDGLTYLLDLRKRAPLTFRSDPHWLEYVVVPHSNASSFE